MVIIQIHLYDFLLFPLSLCLCYTLPYRTSIIESSIVNEDLHLPTNATDISAQQVDSFN